MFLQPKPNFLEIREITRRSISVFLFLLWRQIYFVHYNKGWKITLTLREALISCYILLRVASINNRLLYWIIKCLEKCARSDWSERVHNISIKHTAYVTRVHCCDIMHAAYVTDTSARNSRYTLQKKKRLVPRALMSCISTWEILRTFEKCISLVFLKIPACLYNSTIHLARFLFI